ncbi:MAG: DUF1598 domain-containing protein [Candidatus Eisenbacteria bacterium]|nr:DUF1598 domain-containing protein [Candidatus Eisenbacteria bacterium]
MMKKLLVTTGICTFVLLCLIATGFCAVDKPVATREELSGSVGRAVSLKTLQDKVEACATKRTCPDEYLQLCGIKKILGYVLDGTNKDIILIGQTDRTSPPLYLEDFVVALRNTWFLYATKQGNTRYYSAPGCSIDPDPRVLNELQQMAGKIGSSPDLASVRENFKEWQGICRQPQQVRVLGIPHDTRFAKVMVEADYYMKRLVDGSVDLGIPGFESLSGMTLNVLREDSRNSRPMSVPLSFLNRFWFYPGESSFTQDKGVTYINKFEVGLLSEEEFLTERGEVAGTGKPNPLAGKFAKNFSEQYAAIAGMKPIYAELEGLFRFVALTKIMKEKDAITESGMNLDYLMNNYPVSGAQVDETLPGIQNMKEFSDTTWTKDGYITHYVWLPTCGGVSIDAKIQGKDIVWDKTGRLLEIRKNVLSARRTSDAVSWDFPAVRKLRTLE